MTHSLYTRWVDLTSPLFAGPEAVEIVWKMLDESYSEPFRAYHNWEHIGEMLALLDAYSSIAEDRLALEMAIWFHDVIYDTRSQTNEADSADLMEDAVGRAGWGNLPLIKEIRALILDTDHKGEPNRPDGQLIVDIDLAILGAQGDRFMRYEAGIRSEYAWVEEENYKKGRAAILTRFLERPQIYRVPSLTERFEVGARANLAYSLTRLRVS